MNQLFPRHVAAAVLVASLATACGSSDPQQPPAGAPPGDAAFTEIAHQYLEDMYGRNPTLATSLGIHKYDDRLENYSKQAIADEVAEIRRYRDRVTAIDPKTLSPSNQLDREQLLHELDSRVLALDVVRPWATDPDTYSSGITYTAYIMIKRSFAPPDERLRKLVAREKQMPAVLAEARKNLDKPPQIYT